VEAPLTTIDEPEEGEDWSLRVVLVRETASWMLELGTLEVGTKRLP
jgi:hypothetical protein